MRVQVPLAHQVSPVTGGRWSRENRRLLPERARVSRRSAVRGFYAGDLVKADGIPTTTVDRAARDCREDRDDVIDSSSVGEGTSIVHNGRVERPRVELIDGKVLYDGRSLVAWASRVADRIVERCDASRVILYGSVARGDDGPDSDINLLVVMPIVGRRHDGSVSVLNELRDLPVPVDITVVDPEHLNEEPASRVSFAPQCAKGGSLSPTDRTIIAQRWLRWAAKDLALDRALSR